MSVSIYLSLHLFGLVSLQSVEKVSNVEMHKQIQLAEDLYEASLFHEAIPIYQNILSLIDSENDAAAIRFRLSQAFFKIKDYESAANLLKGQQNSTDHLFLLANAYIENGEYDLAIALLQMPSSKNIPTDEVHFELAVAFFYKGDLKQAQTFLEKVVKTSNQRLKILTHFYLARINLLESKWDEAESHLNLTLAPNDPLNYELAFLRGEIFYKRRNYLLAATSFEKAIPIQSPSQAKWYEDTLYYLGMSYMKIADSPLLTLEKQRENFDKSYQFLKQLLELNPTERAWLAHGEYYLLMGRRLKDEQALKKAEELFNDTKRIKTEKVQVQAMLLKAQAHMTYAERDRRFRQLTQTMHADLSFLPLAWHLRGLNDFEEALLLKDMQRKEESHKIFERAAFALDKASEFLQFTPSELSAQAILLQARAYAEQDTENDKQKALFCLNKLWEQKLLNYLFDPLEAYLLYSQLSEKNLPNGIIKLQEGIALHSKSSSLPQALHMLGTLLYRHEDYSLAEETFQKLAEDWPHSLLAPDALYRMAQCAEKMKKDKLIIRNFKQKILDRYPTSSITPEAAFTFFSYQDYLQGDRFAIKHLNAFPNLYPDSPFVLNAFFLIGIDNKRDRRSVEGKWLRKKNLTAAIDYFQEVEIHYERLKSKIPTLDQEHYLLIYYRAKLEKGLSNFILANESVGAKRQIYLEYAQDILQQLLQELRANKTEIVNREPFWQLEEENAYWLTQALVSMQQQNEANQVLSEMLEKYDVNKITRGYFLSRTWSTRGMIALDRQEYSQALDCFLKAEDASKGRVLSTDQRLELLIQQSHCYKELNQNEKAILILSKVVNDDAISNLRIKAMYLRAEIYEKQHRYDLARKQLEAISKKGGQWALKAKEKLEKEYGHH